MRLTLDYASVRVACKFFRQVVQHVETSVCIRAVGLEKNRADQPGVVLTILRTGRAVEVDEDGQIEFAGPLYSLDKIWILRRSAAASVGRVPDLPVLTRKARNLGRPPPNTLRVFEPR